MKKRRSRAKSAPRYRLHKASGQAVVSLNGSVVYLGDFNSAESQEKYRRLIPESWNTVPADHAISTANEATITDLAVKYALHCKDCYRKPHWCSPSGFRCI